MGGLGIRATASLTDIVDVSFYLATWSLVKGMVTKALSRYSTAQNFELAIALKMLGIYQKVHLLGTLPRDSIVRFCDEH